MPCAGFEDSVACSQVVSLVEHAADNVPTHLLCPPVWREDRLGSPLRCDISSARVLDYASSPLEVYALPILLLRWCAEFRLQK